MKRDIEWTERLEGGIKRTVRVSMPGGKVVWQFNLSDQEGWDRESEPTPDDWATLEEKLEARYTRRRVPLQDLELVRRLRRGERDH